MVVSGVSMQLVGEPSQVLKPEHLQALGSVVPPLEVGQGPKCGCGTHAGGCSGLQDLFHRESFAIIRGCAG